MHIKLQMINHEWPWKFFNGWGGGGGGEEAYIEGLVQDCSDSIANA